MEKRDEASIDSHQIKSSQSTWYQSWRLCSALAGGESVPVLSSLPGEVGEKEALGLLDCSREERGVAGVRPWRCPKVNRWWPGGAGLVPERSCV
jgi:hypothetical protein